MYEVLLTKRAMRDLEKLDERIRLRILKKLKAYAENPLKHARKLISPKIGTYRFRIGNYRVIFDIEDKKLIVLRIGHRSTIYK